jgi:hypothetical protein
MSMQTSRIGPGTKETLTNGNRLIRFGVIGAAMVLAAGAFAYAGGFLVGNV